MNIELENLTVAFGETVAVDELSLSVKSGEMLVLLGPSGCGKTTTMRCLAGLERPRSGRISIGDKDVTDVTQGIDVPPHRRQVGMVFQSYAIWPHMTVFENVAFPLKMEKVPRDERRGRVEEILEVVGLGGFATRPASRLSGGQMQRVAVARSLVMRPQVLLFDEPLSNLDAKLRDKLRFELRELQQSFQITSLYVTHDQSEAMALGDRIAVMRDGKVVQLDGPRRLYAAPVDTFVADFLGVDNIFEVDGVEDGHVRLDGHDGEALRLRLDADAPVPEGPLSVCIRADDVAVTETAGTAESNLWQAGVVSYSFLGSHVRYHLQVHGGPPVYALVEGRSEPFERGSTVWTHLPAASLQVLPRAPATGRLPAAAG